MTRLSEHTEAVLFMRAVAGLREDWPELRWLAAVPNGGHRAKAAAAKLKAEGTNPGVPDYLLPVARGPHPGLAIELKTATGGRLSPAQREWLAHLHGQGWRVSVAHGWSEATDTLRDYLTLDGGPTWQD